MELTYDNGGTSTISLDEEACTASLDSAGVSSLDELVGQPWSIVLPALEQPIARLEWRQHMLDLVIRNGLIVDGSGLPGRHGDVSIRDGKVVAVGGRAGDAHRVLDATGRVVAPGFIDPHTHYDAQLCFDPYAFPAIEHGITTVVPGNCSLSLAPLRTDQRDAFSRMFRLIEEMPEAAFDAGVDWRWGEGFGGWLDALAENIALNVAPLVGHSVLRMYVMGPEAQVRAATADEIAAMADLLRACLDAGAVGLSTSFVDVDETYRPVPSRWAGTGRTRRAVGRARRARRGPADRPRVLRHRADDRPHRAAGRPVAAPRHHHHAVAAVPLRRQQRRRRTGSWARSKPHEPAAPPCGRRCRPARSTSASRSTSAA